MDGTTITAHRLHDMAGLRLKLYCELMVAIERCSLEGSEGASSGVAFAFRLVRV